MTAFPETKRAWTRLKAAWADYLLARRQHRAAVRLEKLIRKRQQSYEVISYRKHREAALKHTRAAA